MRSSVSRLASSVGLLFLASLACPVSPEAATVTDLGDTGAAGQLRTLINGAAAGDTISIPAGTIALTAGQLQISKALTILGAGAGACASASLAWPCSVIDGNNNDRVLFIFDAVVAPNVTMSDVVVQSGKPSADGGGGILNFGHLTLANAIVGNNNAKGGRTRADVGGGLRNAGGATMALTNVAVTGNSAVGGGGIFNNVGATATVTDVTVSGNNTQDILGGAGVYNAGTATLNRVTVSANTTGWFGGGIANGGTATVTDVTVSGNTAVSGGGIFSCSSNELFCLLTQGTVLTTLTNVTIAGNTATGLGGIGGILILAGTAPLTNVIVSANTPPNCSGAITSLGHNLDSGANCGFAAAGDLSSLDPLLGPLQDNGGLTLTRALLAGSPAIDAGTNTGCPPSDQRGVARPQGPACDIGAYEATSGGATTPPAPIIGSGPVSPTKQTAATFVFSDADPAASLLCALDDSAPGAFALCTSPQSYGPGLAEGAHTFFVKAHNLAGDSDLTAFTWTIDLTAPGAIIDSIPLDPTNQPTATFTFHATEPGSTLECRLDGTAFTACTSPASYSGLADGRHGFAVRATDLAGNTGNLASFGWTVDTQGLDAVIDSAPPLFTSSNTATFTFHAIGAIGFTCQLDAQPPAACDSGTVTYSGLDDGLHTFTVKATDALGNAGPGGTVCWIVNQTPVSVGTTTVPIIRFARPVPPPNISGWSNTDVSIPFTVSDASPGIATVTPASPLVLSAEGSAGTGAVTATGNGGAAWWRARQRSRSTRPRPA